MKGEDPNRGPGLEDVVVETGPEAEIEEKENIRVGRVDDVAHGHTKVVVRAVVTAETEKKIVPEKVENKG